MSQPYVSQPDPGPIGRDAIFRIASISKPIAGVAAMLLLQDGAMALDDPVKRWLPEFAEPKVLRSLESELDETVPATRPITVEDVLSFRLGFGSIMAPGPFPVTKAEQEQGTRWRYNTIASVAGVLIERVAGAPLAEVLRERVFEPLGMTDTGFWVPAVKRDRFTTFYAPGAEGEGLRVLDRPDGWWSEPLKWPDASGALVSTADDLYRFASMLAAGGGSLLSADSVRLMTRDRMTAAERAENRIFLGDHSGWGLMMLVPAGEGSQDGEASEHGEASEDGEAGHSGVPGGFGWEGGSGTTWRTDTRRGLTGILLTQRMVMSPEPTQVVRDFWAAAYDAVDD